MRCASIPWNLFPERAFEASIPKGSVHLWSDIKKLGVSCLGQQLWTVPLSPYSSTSSSLKALFGTSCLNLLVISIGCLVADEDWISVIESVFSWIDSVLLQRLLRMGSQRLQRDHQCENHHSLYQNYLCTNNLKTNITIGKPDRGLEHNSVVIVMPNILIST